MQEAGRIYLSTWIRKADNAYRASKDLSEIHIYGGDVPMFLLHWSIELYLKGFLFGHNICIRGHKLKNIYQQCIVIDPKIDKTEVSDLRGTGTSHPSFWVNFIDVFGAEKGGVRYLNKEKTMFTYPSNIYNHFDPLIQYIKENIDGDTDITKYC